MLSPDDPRIQVTRALLASANESVMAIAMPRGTALEPGLPRLPEITPLSIFDPIREWLDAVAAYLKSIPERLKEWLEKIRDRIPAIPSAHTIAIYLLNTCVIPAIKKAGPILAGVLSTPLRWVKEALRALPGLFDFAKEIWQKPSWASSGP